MLQNVEVLSYHLSDKQGRHRLVKSRTIVVELLPNNAFKDAEDSRKLILSCKTRKVIGIVTVEEEVEKAIRASN